MRITAKYDGKCGECGQPTKRGDEIEYVGGKAYHPECAESEPAPSGTDDRRNPKSDLPSAKDDGYQRPTSQSEAERIADELGFTK